MGRRHFLLLLAAAFSGLILVALSYSGLVLATNTTEIIKDQNTLRSASAVVDKARGSMRE